MSCQKLLALLKTYHPLAGLVSTIHNVEPGSVDVTFRHLPGTFENKVCRSLERPKSITGVEFVA
jgi:hypothetical protein